MVKKTKGKVIHFLERPLRVFIMSLSLALLIVVVDGSLWRFWSLRAGQTEMHSRVVDLKNRAKALEFKIHQAEKLTYIERQAADQFDYVREGDLIFVFTD